MGSDREPNLIEENRGVERMSEIISYGPKNLPLDEFLSQGHRACQGCAEVLALRLVLKGLGKDTMVANATGCMEIISSPMPITSWDIPYIHVAFENAAAVCSGMESGLKALMRKGRIPRKKINCIAVAGDGGTADIGIQALSGALERGHDMIYICLDNEAYMNTGIQRSSSTPYGAMTTTSPPGRLSKGQATWKKNMSEIAAAHGIPYVATACPSYPWDLLKKVQKAALVEGPAYLHILSVCPTGWRSLPEESIELGKLAVQTRIFPLYEVENGRYRLVPKPPKQKPIVEYFKKQGRFRHLTDETIAEIQEKVDEDFRRLEARVRITQELPQESQ
jgi:pyruvate ferredoxin oxidoreductase beta subunit